MLCRTDNKGLPCIKLMATKLYFCALVAKYGMLCKVVPTFGSVDEIKLYDHPNY